MGFKNTHAHTHTNKHTGAHTQALGLFYNANAFFGGSFFTCGFPSDVSFKMTEPEETGTSVLPFL